MNIAAHLEFWSQGIDPIVWMRVARALFFVVAGVLMLREPMMCGGKNTAFHRMLAVVFFLWAFYSYDLAQARMETIFNHNITATTSTLIFSEMAMMLASIAIVAKLAYDYVQWKEFNRVRLEYSECKSNCLVQFNP